MENIKDKSILVTGGAGFIGSHIVEYLLNNGIKFVRILDNLSTGFEKNIEGFKQYDNFEFMLGDTTNYETCVKALNGIDIVCHQAALGSIPRSIDNPLNSHNSNVNGFLNVLHAAKELGIKKFVYASSSSVYGDIDTILKTESLIGNQMSPYAVTKYVNELYAKIYVRTYGMQCIGLRYFNVFGPRQNPNGPYAAVIPKFISVLHDNHQVVMYGDGTHSRDFTFVFNIVHANILAMSTNNNECYGNIFNIGTNNNTNINDLYCIIKSIMCKNIEAVHGNPRLGDVLHSMANIENAQSILGYNPIVSMHDGLKLTVESFLK